MTNPTVPRLPDPTIREEGPFLMAGIREFRKFEERAAIPGQWQRFAPFIGNIPGQQGRDAYGVCLAPPGGQDGFDYLTAVAVHSLNELPEALSGVRLSRRQFAIFQHGEHVSRIGETCDAIFGEWQPRSGRKSPSEPLILIEHYGAAFDPVSGRGGIEVWVPLQA